MDAVSISHSPVRSPTLGEKTSDVCRTDRESSLGPRISINDQQKTWIKRNKHAVGLGRSDFPHFPDWWNCAGGDGGRSRDIERDARMEAICHKLSRSRHESRISRTAKVLKINLESYKMGRDDKSFFIFLFFTAYQTSILYLTFKLQRTIG